jgi:pimeloyl-ACP methyl ester carboxylesterase
VLVAAATTFDAAGKQGLRDRAAAVRSSGMTPIADTMTSVGLSARTLSSNPVAKLFVRQSLTTTPPEGYALASLAIAAAPEPDYSRIQAKNVVILAGREDKRIPEVTTRFFESSIKGAKVVWLENVGHWLAVEDVESTAKALSESL